jgi:hypothetical protein
VHRRSVVEQPFFQLLPVREFPGLPRLRGGASESFEILHYCPVVESPYRHVRNLALHPVLLLREISNNFSSLLRDLVVPMLGMGEGLPVVAGQVQLRRAVVGLCLVFYLLRLAVSAEDVVAKVFFLGFFLQLCSETLYAQHGVVGAVLPRLQIIRSQLSRPHPVY